MSQNNDPTDGCLSCIGLIAAAFAVVGVLALLIKFAIWIIK